MNHLGMFDVSNTVRQPDLANLGREDAASAGADAEALKYPRLHGRLPLETLSCNLGEVLDLSGGGMRIRSTRLPVVNDDQPLVITIADYPQLTPLQARMVWSKKTGWFRCEFGVQFENLTPGQSQILAHIAMTCRERRSM